jgi:uncharacterized Rmd1/YagE family protein
MENTLFAGRQGVVARALYLAQRIRIQGIDWTERLAVSPLALRAGASGVAVIFRYGVVVLFGLDPAEEAAFVHALGPMLEASYPEGESDQAQLILEAGSEDRVEPAGIVVSEFTVERLQLVADVLAKSLVLGHHEVGINENFDRIEPMASTLREKGRGGRQSRELVRHIGDTLSIQGRMVGLVEVHDKPELLWESPQLGRFYSRLAEEYELAERHRALERKLDVISRTAETLLNLLQSKRSLRVEWYIVILIVVEIVIMIGEKTF